MSDEHAVNDEHVMRHEQAVSDEQAAETTRAESPVRGRLLTRHRVVAGTRGLLLLTAITLTVSRAVPIQSPVAAITRGSSTIQAATIQAAEGEASGRAATAPVRAQASARATALTALRGRRIEPVGTASIRGTDATGRSADVSMSEDLFATHTWRVLPPPPPPPPPAPPPVPTAPPFPYTFVGAYTAENTKTVFFLSHADRVIDAHVGDRIDGVYDFESADAGQLVFNYLPLNIRQSLSAGAAP
jgi:hypothetical protein